MEADWEVEIGPGAPIIEASWEGFADLCRWPGLISQIPEAMEFPALAEALIRINRVADPSNDSAGGGGNGLLWTSKCDIFIVDPTDVVEGNVEGAASAVAVYIDLLPRESLVFPTIAEAEFWARSAVAKLRQAANLQCRVDLILRRAIAGRQEGLGVTAYISAAGPTAEAARKTLSFALQEFANALCP